MLVIRWRITHIVLMYVVGFVLEACLIVQPRKPHVVTSLGSEAVLQPHSLVVTSLPFGSTPPNLYICFVFAEYDTTI
jgi:hypothetical protein